MISILTIDGDTEFTQLLSIYLQSAGGFVLSVAHSAATGYQLLADQGFDLVLLESELPQLSSFEVLRTLRRSGDDTPVIMFSARGENLERYNLMEYQPDLFLPKSIRLPELVQGLRCLHQAHESTSLDLAPVQISLRQLRLDGSRLSAEFHGRDLQLNVIEFTLLEHLARRPGEAHKLSSLMRSAQQQGVKLDPASLEQQINNLCRKLGPGANGNFLLCKRADQHYVLDL